MSWAETLVEPQGLAIGGGFIYCANYFSGTISKISLSDPSGPDTDLSWLILSGKGTSYQPFGLEIDNTNGFLYCALFYLGIIIKINLNTKLYINITTIATPVDIALEYVSGSPQFMYISKILSNSIDKYDFTNNITYDSWKVLDTGALPRGLVIINGFLYSANSGLNTISKISLIDPNGPNTNLSWLTTTYSNPSNLATDGLNIYCSYAGSNIISKISLSNPSDIIDLWATSGPISTGLAIGIPNNYIYVASSPSGVPGAIWKINLTTPCFNKGTKILCLNSVLEEEYIPIEDLKKGDLVKSYLHGYRKIDSIGGNKMINNPEHFNLSMYKMEKTLENGLTDDLIVTGGHSILVDDLGDYYAENEVRFKGTIPKIDDKFLLLCFLTKDFIQLTDRNRYTYYHLVLENNGNNDERFGIWANGILTETISKNQFIEIEKILH